MMVTILLPKLHIQSLGRRLKLWVVKLSEIETQKKLIDYILNHFIRCLWTY